MRTSFMMFECCMSLTVFILLSVCKCYRYFGFQTDITAFIFGVEAYRIDVGE